MPEQHPTITEVAVSIARVPPHRPMYDAVQSMEALELVVVRLRDSAGGSGTGFTYTLGRGGTAIAELITGSLARFVLGQDPAQYERIHHDMHWGIHWIGRTGASQLAISAVDIAVWDLLGRRAGEPLWKLLGGSRQSITAYNTDCGWLQLDQSELVDGAQRAVGQGFTAVKIKVGRPTLREDHRRLAAVRDAVGDAIQIMIDANHAFTPAEAARRAAAFEELGIAWFEEPIRADDVQGHARLRDATRIPLALGESLYSLHEVKEYVAAGAVDVLQADVCRIGGFTTWRKAAALAEAWGIEVAPHHMMELHVHAAAASPAATFVEYIPALSAAVVDPLDVRDGTAYAPGRPGHGIEFRDGLLEPLATVAA